MKKIEVLRLGTSGFILTTFFIWTALAAYPAAAQAADKQESAQLVEKARLTLESFMNDPNMDAFRDLLKRADGVVIAPALLKGAFIVGGMGGNAVFMARDEKTGKWSEPAFYTIGGASIGLQAGGQASEMILLVMTQRGVSALLGNSLKLGGDIGVAAGPYGMGAAAATANLSADILSFSRSKGLYGGISLEGAVIAVRGGLNKAFYGRTVSPADILVLRDVENPRAAGLMQEISRFAAQKTASMNH